MLSSRRASHTEGGTISGAVSNRARAAATTAGSSALQDVVRWLLFASARSHTTSASTSAGIQSTSAAVRPRLSGRQPRCSSELSTRLGSHSDRFHAMRPPTDPATCPTRSTDTGRPRCLAAVSQSSSARNLLREYPLANGLSSSSQIHHPNQLRPERAQHQVEVDRPRAVQNQARARAQRGVRRVIEAQLWVREVGMQEADALCVEGRCVRGSITGGAGGGQARHLRRAPAVGAAVEAVHVVDRRPGEQRAQDQRAQRAGRAGQDHVDWLREGEVTAALVLSDVDVDHGGGKLAHGGILVDGGDAEIRAVKAAPEGARELEHLQRVHAAFEEVGRVVHAGPARDGGDAVPDEARDGSQIGRIQRVVGRVVVFRDYVGVRVQAVDLGGILSETGGPLDGALGRADEPAVGRRDEDQRLLHAGVGWRSAVGLLDDGPDALDQGGLLGRGQRPVDAGRLDEQRGLEPLGADHHGGAQLGRVRRDVVLHRHRIGLLAVEEDDDVVGAGPPAPRAGLGRAPDAEDNLRVGKRLISRYDELEQAVGSFLKDEAARRMETDIVPVGRARGLGREQLGGYANLGRAIVAAQRHFGGDAVAEGLRQVISLRCLAQ
ncbi:ca533616-7de2-45c0-8dc2-209cd2a3abf4 [Thermothielavioides terrestris]|uniref:Ca533616-7de2-45c0-8dc2-209cd2a3abf4 n=1 Tax=Thermothielavioides terrestris TaxID=2587410 RepID=A0A446BYC7_9PEZI|nr:ca533616-7de2-45c0-8dc2-209cd2a3abf4 [Thermothielavioides terrestris]